MEILSFYQIARLIASAFVENTRNELLISILGGLLVWGILFVLQGIGLSTMAKKRGMKNRVCAFIPFVNIWYIGKLAGECNFFGQRLKRGGVYAMIAQIVATLLTVAMISAEVYLTFTHGEPMISNDGYVTAPYWQGLVGFDLTVFRFYDLSSYILPIAQLVVEILFLILMMALCKKYAPKNHLFLSFLVLFMPASRFIVIFALRNRKEFDYEAYVRARQEEYMRQRQRYYTQGGNPYGQNPYGNPYGQNPYGNPYAQNPQNGGSRRAEDEPFAEFGSAGQEGSSEEKTDGDSDGYVD
ncbi:MAG: hypothetical protein IKZ28_00980 [Clostridia bacterium]|nr:hypothetical protein [Clostridia bacterium]